MPYRLQHSQHYPQARQTRKQHSQLLKVLTALRASEQRYRAVVMATAAVTWVTDARGECTAPQPDWEAYTGQQWPEYAGRQYLLMVHPDDRELFGAVCPQTPASPVECTARLWHAPTAAWRYCRLRKVPLLDRNGSVREWVGACVEIDEQVRAEQASAFLAQAGHVLASSLDYEVTLRTVAGLAVPHMADWCAVDLFDAAGRFERLAVAHVDPAKIQWAYKLYQRYPFDPNAPRGVANVLRTGKSELYPAISDALLVASARDAEHLEMLRSVGFRSAIIVPLTVGQRILGAITFVTTDESNRLYSGSDLDLAEELARRAALAVDNAGLYRQAEQALAQQRLSEQRLRRLVEASAALLESLERRAVVEAILSLSSQLVQADAYALWRREAETCTWRTIGEWGLSEHFERELREPTDQDRLQDGPIVAEDVEQLPMLEMRKAAYRAEGIVSLLGVPLNIGGSNTGTLIFYFRTPHRFSEGEIDAAMAFGHIAACTLGAAEAFDEQHQMRLEAEAANRGKDEFLALLSHELRTPLNPIIGWTQLLRRGTLAPGEQYRALEVIERNAKLQLQLVSDVLDIARIIAGKLSCSMQTVQLDALVRSACEGVRQMAEDKRIDLQLELPSDLPLVHADPVRLQQVLWNLLTNAIKFTPEQGWVRLVLQHNAEQVQLVVSDNGIGIEPAFLPWVFERFRQADSTSTRRQGGLGLGLAIVRHIVEAHGGQVRAASEGLGQGATFTVSLPLSTAQTSAR